MGLVGAMIPFREKGEITRHLLISVNYRELNAPDRMSRT